MACKTCGQWSDEAKALIAQGREFLAQAEALCQACPERKDSRCSLCGCHLSFKILGGLLIKSHCPLDKW